MLLLTLLACESPFVVEGDYDIVFDEAETDCAPEDAPRAPVQALFRFLPDGEDALAVLPFDVSCPRVDGRFDCALSEWDAGGIDAAAGIDAVVDQDLEFEGSWPRNGHATGALTWSTTCDGADCDLVADASPPFCTTSWAWTATRRDGTLSQEDSEAGRCDAPSVSVNEIANLGAASWDPLVANVETGWSARFLVDQETSLVAAEPLVIDPYVPASARLYTADLAAGEAHVSSAWVLPDTPGWDPDGCPFIVAPVHVRVATDWTVGTFGDVPTFDPASVLGSWDIGNLDETVAGGTGGLGSLIGSYVTGLRLEVLGVGDGTADIRVVSNIVGAEDQQCVVLQDTATLSETGQLSWSKDRIEVPTDPAPLILYEPSLRIGFDGTSGAGGEVRTLADVRATAGTELDVCGIVASFGPGCVPCPDDAEPTCLPLAGFAWTATRSDVEPGADLPFCGADFSDTGVVPDISIDCGGTSGSLCAGSWVVLLTPLLRRRRGERA